MSTIKFPSWFVARISDVETHEELVTTPGRNEFDLSEITNYIKGYYNNEAE